MQRAFWLLEIYGYTEGGINFAQCDVGGRLTASEYVLSQRLTITARSFGKGGILKTTGSNLIL